MKSNILRLLYCGLTLSAFTLGSTLKADDAAAGDGSTASSTDKPHHHHHCCHCKKKDKDASTDSGNANG
jgi:hypothetical protein